MGILTFFFSVKRKLWAPWLGHACYLLTFARTIFPSTAMPSTSSFNSFETKIHLIFPICFVLSLSIFTLHSRSHATFGLFWPYSNFFSSFVNLASIFFYRLLLRYDERNLILNKKLLTLKLNLFLNKNQKNCLSFKKKLSFNSILF